MTEFGFEEWDAWLARQPPEQKARAEQLAQTFRSLACSDPEGWAQSEIDEDIAQLARFVLLRRLWLDELQGWRDVDAMLGMPMAKRLVDAGAAPEEVQLFGGSIAAMTAFQLLNLIDTEQDLECSEEVPGWRLMEVDRRTGELTGRNVGGLHESLTEVDPENREGDPFF